MSKIFKNLIPYWRWIILIFVFLIAQAYCDLALPAYTSDIIDVGIQDHGIEHILPKEITSEDYQMAQTFMLSDEKEKFTDCYEAQDASKSDDGVAKYKLTADSDTLDKLDEELLVPLVMAYQAFQSGEQMDVDASAIPQGVALDDNMIKQIRSKVQEKIDAVGSATLKSMGVTFATKCDENAGIDVDANQVAYLWKAGAKMAAFAAIMLIAACVVGFAASKVGAAVGRDLREKTFSKVVGFSNAEINKFSTASLITRSTNDIQQIQMVTTMMLRMVLYAPIVGIGGIIKVAQTKSGMEWVIAIAVAAIMVFIFTLVGIAMPKFKIMQSLVDKVNLVSREILTGLSVIRAFGREKEEEKRFDEANRELTRTQLFTNRVMTFMMPGMSMIMYCITLGIVWVAAGRIDKGSMQVGTMTAFITYAMMIVMSFLMLSAMSIMLPRAGVAAERIDEVIKTNSTVNDPKEPVTEADHRGVIRFNHVDFRYPGAKEDVLSDIDFVAEPGKTTAIIGSTGCGKSTLVNLIPRFYDVTGGSIELDGHDIRDYTLSELRESIGFVPQKGILFSGTIASNLRFGKADASDEQIKKAADIAQASEFIETKNDRYESSIAQGGSNVSGGQKQRLAIARAIAKDPHIYVFDDSFSALDMKTDARLRAALAEVTESASVIIVAQRISTIIHADQILVLDDGKIVGKGTHEELLKNCDVYMQIAQSQLSARELGIDDNKKEGIKMSENNNEQFKMPPKRPRGPMGRGPGMVTEKARDFKGSTKKLIKYLGRYWAAIIAVMIFAAVSTVFSVAGPKVMGKATTALAEGLMNKIAGTGGIDFDYIAKILLFTLALYVVSAIFMFAQGLIMTGITQKTCYRMRKDITSKINRMPMKYFESRTYGEVLSRITNDVDTLGQSLNQSITQIITSVATLVGTLVMMLSISPLMTLISLVILPVSMILISFVIKHSQKYFRQQQEYLGHINGQVEEVYGGHLVIKAYNKEAETVKTFKEANNVLYKSAWKSQFLSGLMMPIMQFVGNLGYAGVAISGGILAIKNVITIGDIQAFIQYVKNFTQPIQQIAQVANQLQSMAAASERVFEFLDEEEEDITVENPVKPDHIEGSVEFSHVHFGYNPDQIIINDFSAKVKPGQQVAIVGPTGAGKTTMVKLLMRFYDVSSGAILVDGHDIRDYNRADLRDAFGMVLQDTWLFKGTIMENIRYGRLDATDEEVIAAAKAAHAHHFIQTLPGGYDMELNEDASNVSQGQKQLLTIARAILADNPILILDEATSSVDTRTEIRIQKALDNLMKGRTSFVIAHRLSTIKNADMILVMKDGDIIEQGTHDELLAKNGFYAELYNSQFEE